MRTQRLMASEKFYLADGGLETWLIFNKGFDLPCFSAAVLLDSETGREALEDYFTRYLAIARKTGRGFVLDAPTWRAGMAWAGPLGVSPTELVETNRRAVAFALDLRQRHEHRDLPILVNGLVGPAGDAYAPDTILSEHEALAIHAPQVSTLAQAGVDMISAMTLTHAEEAIGITHAAGEAGVPVVIAFTLETDGRLPSGQALGDAITQVDAVSGKEPLYYMINCAHPDHFRDVLEGDASWATRIGGVRANASRMSHAELDACETLDDGDPEELAKLNADLLAMLPSLRVIGGCCGTDHRHVGCIASHRREAALAIEGI